jgi:RimJ/RimL family protein N-acetyltransferase
MQLPNNIALHTERLTLRLVAATDMSDLMEVNGDPQVTRYLPYRAWSGLADAQAWYDRMATRAQANESWQWVVVQRSTGRVIGTCLVFGFDWPSQRAEVGYVLGQSHWGAGIMYEAMVALVDYLFDEAKFRRLDAAADARNLASCKLLERLGFVREGLLRQHSLQHDELPDMALFGLLRDERAWQRRDAPLAGA